MAAGAALTAPTATGNVASAVAPEALKQGVHYGDRDRGLSTLKSRAGWIRGLLALDNLPPQFRSKLQGDLNVITPQLQKMSAIDWLTNVAYAAGARQSMVNQLDKATIVVVPDEKMDSDAAFDEERGIIRVRESMLRKLEAELDSLARKNVIDRGTGAVVDAKALRSSSEYHDLIVTQALIGAHELGHADQSEAGHLDQARVGMQPLIDRLLRTGDTNRATIEADLVRQYVNDFEYEAYAAQERYQWEMGAAPKTVSWMTIDNSGDRVDRARAIDNIVKFLRGGSSFDAGAVIGLVGSSEQQAVAVSHGYRVPGYRVPGYRVPGNEIAGYRVPGYRVPGDELAGYRVPGYTLK